MSQGLKHKEKRVFWQRDQHELRSGGRSQQSSNRVMG